MYFARRVQRSDLEGGHTFVHGSARLNLSAADLTTFVDPADAALLFGFRALDPNDGFDNSWPVWMATLRRRGGDDAIVETLRRIFPNLVDGPSIATLVRMIVDHARSLGYAKLWLT